MACCNFYQTCRYCREYKYYTTLKHPCKCTEPVCKDCIKKWTSQNSRNVSNCPECHGNYKWKKRRRVKRDPQCIDWVAVYVVGIFAWIFTGVFALFIGTIFWCGRLYHSQTSNDDMTIWYIINGVFGGTIIGVGATDLFAYDEYPIKIFHITLSPPKIINSDNDIPKMYNSIGKILLKGFVVDAFIIILAIIFHPIGSGVLILFDAYPYDGLRTGCDFTTQTLCLNIDVITFLTGILTVLCIGVAGICLGIIVATIISIKRAVCQSTHIYDTESISHGNIDMDELDIDSYSGSGKTIDISYVTSSDSDKLDIESYSGSGKTIDITSVTSSDSDKPKQSV